MKPYSKDLRIRVLAAVDGGEHPEGRGGANLLRLGALHQALAQAPPPADRLIVAPRPIPGRTPPVKGAALEEWLPEHLKENPNLTLEEHCRAFSRRRRPPRRSPTRR